MQIKKETLMLYAVTDRSWLNGDTLYSQVEKALKGGATLVQLREKNLSNDDFLKEAVEINNLCKKYFVPFIVNDNLEIAVAVDADGVHIGQEDMDPEEARKIIGNNKILGVSAQTVEQALDAQAKGADYLGIGAVFSTGTKNDAIEVPHEILKQICSSVDIPAVAIGGITFDNLPELSKSGIVGVALVSAIFAQKDIELECRKLKSRIKETIIND